MIGSSVLPPVMPAPGVGPTGRPRTGGACPWRRPAGRYPRPAYVAANKSSRDAPRGAPLSHHRTYGSRITAVSDKVQRGILLPRQGSFMIPCRRRLRLLSRPRSGSAFPAGAVAQRGLQGFVEKVPLVRAALLPLHVHRLVQALLPACRIQPFARLPGLLWPLLTSPGPSEAVAGPLFRSSGEIGRSPRVKH